MLLLLIAAWPSEHRHRHSRKIIRCCGIMQSVTYANGGLRITRLDWLE